MTHIFKYIKAAQFFPKYAPKVTNWQHKLRKFDGNKKPIDFTESDKMAIKNGLDKMYKEIT